MRIENETYTIDDKLSFTISTYIAEDGKKFSFENECVQYEKELEAKEKMKHIPVVNSSIMGYNTWYYISSYEDLKIFQNYITVVIQKSRKPYFEYFTTNRNNRINTWISYEIEYVESNMDYYCNIISFEEIQKNFEQFEKDFKNLKINLKGDIL